jgi:hypothetical protein
MNPVMVIQTLGWLSWIFLAFAMAAHTAYPNTTWSFVSLNLAVGLTVIKYGLVYVQARPNRKFLESVLAGCFGLFTHIFVLDWAKLFVHRMSPAFRTITPEDMRTNMILQADKLFGHFANFRDDLIVDRDLLTALEGGGNVGGLFAMLLLITLWIILFNNHGKKIKNEAQKNIRKARKKRRRATATA